MKLKIYTIGQAKAEEITLPKVLAQKPNLVVLSQAIRVYHDRSHPGTAYAKTRGEVNISTRKIYRQKGTGGARHGAKSAPIFVGGGVAHGPKGVKHVLGLSKKLKVLALKSALSLKASQGSLVLVEKLPVLKKTKEADKFIKGIMEAFKVKKATVVIGEKSRQSRQLLRNLPYLKIIDSTEMNAFNIYLGGLVIVDSQVFLKPKKA